MAFPRKSEIFATLNQKKHHVNEYAQRALFPEHEVPNINIDSECWYYSDLHNLFGQDYFPTEPTIDAHVWPNLVMPSKSNGGRKNPPLTHASIDFWRDHTATFQHTYHLGNIPKIDASDMKLSRYACWSLCRDNPYMIFSRIYFISPIIAPNISYDDLRAKVYQFARIRLRERLTYFEKFISGIIHRYNGDFRQIYHEMNRAFFYGCTANDIKDAYQIPLKTNDPLSNYMGPITLQARANAFHRTIDRFNMVRHKNLETFRLLLCDTMTQERVRTIQQHEIRPEQDIYTTDVDAVNSELSKIERDFINKYSQIKLR